jgi:hypothetical protein
LLQVFLRVRSLHACRIIPQATTNNQKRQSCHSDSVA